MLRAALSEAAFALFCGLRDSLRFDLALRAVSSSVALWLSGESGEKAAPHKVELARALGRVLLLNGVVLATNAVYLRLMFPMLQNAVEGAVSGVLASLLLFLFASPYGLIALLWMVPSWIFSVLKNSSFHYHVAQSAHLALGKEKAVEIKEEVSAELYRSALFIAFTLVSSASAWIPVVGSVVGWCLHGWIYSVFIFDYKWRFTGATMQSSIVRFESCWLYFVGFGTTLTLAVALISSYWIAYPLVNLALPFLCIISVWSEPVAQQYVFSLPLRAISEATLLKPMVSFAKRRRDAKKRAQSSKKANAVRRRTAAKND